MREPEGGVYPSAGVTDRRRKEHSRHGPANPIDLHATRPERRHAAQPPSPGFTPASDTVRAPQIGGDVRLRVLVDPFASQPIDPRNLRWEARVLDDVRTSPSRVAGRPSGSARSTFYR